MGEDENCSLLPSAVFVDCILIYGLRHHSEMVLLPIEPFDSRKAFCQLLDLPETSNCRVVGRSHVVQLLEFQGRSGRRPVPPMARTQLEAFFSQTKELVSQVRSVFNADEFHRYDDLWPPRT